MSLKILKQEILQDPLNRGYSNMSNAEIVSSLNTPNIQKYKTISSARLLAWSGFNSRRAKIKDAALNHPNADVKNITDIAITMLDRDSTEIDLNLLEHVQLIEILRISGVLSDSDVVSLYDLGKIYISRSQELNLGQVLDGDVNWARNN